MDPKDLVAGKKYQVTLSVDVCFYHDDVCNMQDMITLPAGTDNLVYLGQHAADDGYIFENSEGIKYCLHDNDLACILPVTLL